MSTTPNVIDEFRDDLERVRAKLQESHLGAVRNLLTDKIILGACVDVGVTFRTRVLTPVITVLHMIAVSMSTNASTHAGGSFRAAWNMFGGQRISSAALSKARGRLSEKHWRTLHTIVSKIAGEASAPWASRCLAPRR